ncbi:MAG: alpha/beta hydrolase [Candidatus Binatia bacterium]
MPSPTLDAVIALLRSRPRPATLDPHEMRAGIEALTAAIPLPDDVLREPVTAAGVPAEWVTAAGAAPDAALLYLHGGGYVIGSITTHRDLAARLSRAAGARVLVIDYRLAPEHPHPAALEDATAAYRWLLDEGHSPARLAVAGDSAGGGLTVATLVALRDAGVPLPSAGVCLSPWVDLEGTGESMRTKADADPMVDAGGLRQMAAMYLGGQDPRTPLAAPLHADLRGLPPLLIHVGTAETLLDDSTRLADRAQAAGVDVTLELWEDMIHVFHAFAAILPEGQEAIERVGGFLRARRD